MQLQSLSYVPRFGFRGHVTTSSSRRCCKSARGRCEHSPRDGGCTPRRLLLETHPRQPVCGISRIEIEIGGAYCTSFPGAQPASGCDLTIESLRHPRRLCRARAFKRVQEPRAAGARSRMQYRQVAQRSGQSTPVRHVRIERQNPRQTRLRPSPTDLRSGTRVRPRRAQSSLR
jgi:hypothetical protein